MVVPQHIKAQQHINEYHVDGVKNQSKFVTPFSLKALPKPFDKRDLVVFHELYCPVFLKIAMHSIQNKVPYIIVPHGVMTKQAQKKVTEKEAATFLLFNGMIRKESTIQ